MSVAATVARFWRPWSDANDPVWNYWYRAIVLALLCEIPLLLLLDEAYDHSVLEGFVVVGLSLATVGAASLMQGHRRWVQCVTCLGFLGLLTVGVTFVETEPILYVGLTLLTLAVLSLYDSLVVVLLVFAYFLVRDLVTDPMFHHLMLDTREHGGRVFFYFLANDWLYVAIVMGMGLYRWYLTAGVGMDRWRSSSLRQKMLDEFAAALDQTADVARRANVQSDQLTRERDEFYGTMVHQLKTPMSIVQGYAELLDERWNEYSDEDRRLRVVKVREAANQQRHLIDACLVAIRNDVQGWMADCRYVPDLNDIIGRMVDDLTPQYPRLCFEPCCGSVASIKADVYNLRYILEPLVENADRYGNDAVPIVVRLECEPDAMTIAVISQDVPGTAPLTPDVWEPFARTPSGAAKQGSGLGLYIVKRLTESMLGAVSYHQADGQTTFCVRLPRLSSREERTLVCDDDDDDDEPILIWAADATARCNHFNDAWLNFTGRHLDDTIGDGWMMDVHPDDLVYCVRVYNDAFASRLSFQVEYRLRHHSGEYRRVLDHGDPRYDREGAFLGYVGWCSEVPEPEQGILEVLNEKREGT